MFSKITTVVNGTDLTVPSTAKAIANNARLIVYKTTVNQNVNTTALNGAASANDETLTVDSTTGMTAGGVISVACVRVKRRWAQNNIS